MPVFSTRDPQGPATLQAVLEAVVQLSALDESEFLALVNSGKLGELFPFRPSALTESVADFASDSDLIEASPRRLSTQERAALIQSSMPRNANHSPFFEDAGTSESDEAGVVTQNVGQVGRSRRPRPRGRCRNSLQPRRPRVACDRSQRRVHPFRRAAVMFTSLPTARSSCRAG